MKLPLILLLFPLIFTACSKVNSEAETAAERFAIALNRFDAEAMTDEMHSDALKFFKQFLIHLASTPKDEDERGQLLEYFQVSTLDELKDLDPKFATSRFFRFAFGNVRREIKDVSHESSIRIIGSLRDDYNFYVLYRTDLSVEGFDLIVPSVIVLREEDGKLKVLNTTQMETVKSKAYAQGLEQ